MVLPPKGGTFRALVQAVLEQISGFSAVCVWSVIRFGEKLSPDKLPRAANLSQIDSVDKRVKNCQGHPGGNVEKKT